MYSLLHSYYSSYFCQDFLVVYSIPPFTFCRWLESTTNISDSLILLDLVVEFLVGSFQEKFPKLSLLLYKWVRHSFILKGTTRLPWIRAVEGAAPSLTSFFDLFEACDIVAHSIFFKTSPFDLHDAIEKSGVMEWKDNGLWSLANMDLNPDSTYQFYGLTKLLNLSKLQCSVFKKESHITT